MKIILNLLIVVVKLCASDSSVYDWQVRTIERGSDFGDDFKVQTALNNERQQDLLKISGKTNNIDYYPNSYYSQLNKNNDANSNRAAGVNDKHEFGEKINQNPFGAKINMKYDDNSNIKSIFSQIKNSASKYDTKNNEKYKYKNDENDYNEDHLKYDHEDKENDKYSDHQHHREELDEKIKHLDHHDVDNNRYHDLKHIEHNPYKSDKDPDKYKHQNRPPDTNSNNEELENNNTEKISNNHIQNSKENGDFPSVSHCSGKYIDIESFVGTNLFDSTTKRCFSSEEVALLATRKDFESLIPKDLPQCLLNEQMMALLLNYFYICHQMILRMTSMGSKHLAQKAFYDTFGGYLNFYLVPVTKYSYYAGQISLNTAQQILNLHQQSKQLLNTNGNGWKAPLQNVLVELKSIHIEPLHILELDKETCDEPSFCMQLVMAADENQIDDDKMIIQLPKLEAEDVNGYLGNIWLPFKGKRSFDLKSESSAYIVVKFYETVTKCYRFENIDQQYYNHQFKTWLLESINVHLSDKQFYPGLGAVLRIYEYLKRRKKDTNLFGDDLGEMQSEDASFIKYHGRQINNRKVHNIKKTERRINNRKNHTEETNVKLRARNKTMENDSQKPDRVNIEITKSVIDQQPNAITSQEDIKLEAGDHLDFTNSKSLLRTIDLTPPQMAVIAIPVMAIILVVIICCCKSFCKKKKPETPLKPKKSKFFN
ncbi:uncharacterized protein LOC135948904 [Calliphora vicina]|uniref:uncharacterized protein LOC135948904 n=1 Tax=Calliphora vicina TaxID=7373 RepID=UPI00325A871A